MKKNLLAKIKINFQILYDNINNIIRLNFLI